MLCSLGEKQLLAIARLIHHRPKFAILDECTSAVSSEMERRLYEICRKLRIAYVTISHRPALQAYHESCLSIGDGKCGYKLETIDRSTIRQNLIKGTNSIGHPDNENQIKEHLIARSAPYQALRERYQQIIASNKKTKGNNIAQQDFLNYVNSGLLPEGPGTAQRLWRCWQLGKPSNAYLKLFAVGIMILGQTAIEDFQFRNIGRMFGCLMNADKALFKQLVIKAVFSAALQSLLQETFVWIQREAATTFSWHLTKAIQPRYMGRQTYYKLYQLDSRIKDAHYRICHDIKNLGGHLDHMYVQGMRPFAQLLFFTWRIGKHTNICKECDLYEAAVLSEWIISGMYVGWKAPVAMIGYFVLSVLCLRIAMPNYKELYKKVSALTARFTFTHSRIKTCAESIAFFKGDAREREIVTAQFRRLMEVEWDRNWLNFVSSCIDHRASQ
eukprot:SAG31_NODE_770_length_12217_cov_2.855174_4_plen_442_part_00